MNGMDLPQASESLIPVAKQKFHPFPTIPVHPKPQVLLLFIINMITIIIIIVIIIIIIIIIITIFIIIIIDYKDMYIYSAVQIYPNSCFRWIYRAMISDPMRSLRYDL